ncbi:SpaA isopeptide-forming pilin-related protein [Paraclostridium sordellii]|uniref:SpaA isopeptide-forming pilin-related protein n=1 Tax=Paraclostridium sordellii TaxID=1505 RepID=UPI0003856542|nr:SpaA isopeptide-forming pilin-related protein [Paeniclostridium sordellii]AUO31624.1 hypothetical protein [Paeniclostridium sordellii]AUO31718.1 hypothetical protein [Paeniclostridium sordellii]EPZ61093.1 cna B-type domain protein [[Clostridium] sordellii VPI 9048] [Paeniclostridium sordellii VPI 9048]CEK40065.1 probable collagen adhesin (plasmid) [[Clostridium] sordellii] [Paeniclostridium sordellii]
MVLKKFKQKLGKITNSKYMKKVSCITLASALVINTMGGTISAFAEEIQSKSPRSLNVRQDGSPMSFVGDRHGNFLTFPKLRMGDGRFAYCMEHNKPTPNPSGVNYSEGRELDNGVKYILEYEPNTGSADKDYYIKAAALKYYLGQIQWINYAVTGTDIRDHILNLVAQAKGTTLRNLINEDSNIEILNEDQDSIDIKEKSADAKSINEEVSSDNSSNDIVEIHKMNIGNAKSMPRSRVSITASPRTQDFKIVGDNYETDWYNVSIQGDLTSYRMDIKGQPNGTQIINQNGQVVTSLTKNDAKFKLRVPKANANGNFTVKVLLRGSFSDERAVEFIPSNSNYQKVASLQERSVNENDRDYLTANLIGNGGLEVIKKSENGNVLQGAGFKLMKNGADVRGIQETDGNGRTIFNDLAPGEYDLVEVKAPTGHVISHANTKVTVNAGTISTIEVSNEVIKGKVQVLKVDEETGQPLKGAEFELKNKATGKVVEKLVTGEDGKALSGLHPFGEYILQETKAPDKYTLNGQEHFATISEHMKTIEVTVKNRIIKGKIAVEKSDSELEDLKLQGVEFEISNEEGNVVDKLVTDEKGKATSKLLNYGKYFLKETKTLPTHILNPKIYEVNITEDGKVYTYDIKNDVIKGKVQIVKVDKENEEVPVKGAIFDVIATNVFGVKTGTVVDTVTTDKNGFAFTKDLRAGDYKIIETKAPEGYWHSEKEYHVSITENGKVEVKYISNKPIQAKLRVLKSDSKDKLPLANAEFKIVDKKTGKDVEFTDFSGGIIPHKKVVFKTDEKGEFVTPQHLKYGEYQLVEVKAPEGYNLVKPIDFIINEDMSLQEIELLGTITTQKVEDTRITGNMELLKIDSDTKQPLENVEFKVTCLDGFMKDETWDLKSNKDGKVSLKDLEYGKYQIKEVKTIEGYVLNEKPINFEIKENGKTVKLEMTNKMIRGNVEVIKIDSEKLFNMPLKDAEFTIYDKDGKEVDKLVTNIFGYAKSKDLLYGSYTMKETKAPEGYKPSDTVYEINISQYGQIVKFNIENNVKKGKVEVIKKDDKTNKNLAGAEFTIYDKDHKEVEKLVTDKNGYASKDLRYGSYTMQETKAPIGYVLSDKVYEINIDEDGKIVTFEIPNSMIEAEVDFSKTDVSTGETIEGAKIEIAGVSETNKDIKIEFISSKEGNKFKVPYGKYEIREKVAPNGYVLSEEVGTFEIKENGEVVKAELKNKKIEGTLKFEKIDSKTNEVIEGAKIKVECIDGFNKGKVIDFTSSKEGNTINNLLAGKYTISEVEAPKGYIKTKEVGTFEISEDGQVVKVQLKNDKMIVNTVNPKTGDTGGLFISTALALGALTGLLIVNVFVKNRKKDA